MDLGKLAKLSDLERLSRLKPDEKEELLALLEELESRRSGNERDRLFPERGPYRRELYPKHMEFFKAGKTYRERCMMAANRVGKTVAGGYEVSYHLTGDYPDWWEGRKFMTPTRCWVAGKTSETTRDILQTKLFGPVKWYGAKKGVAGTGLIPRNAIVQDSITWKAGVPNLIDTVSIKHASGGISELGLKSYEQGRGSFEGTERHVIWFDEEPPLDVYGEAIMRTATTDGLVMITFTPLDGLSGVVLEFLPHMKPSAERGLDA